MNAIESHERALTCRLLQGTESTTGLLDMGHVTVYGEVDDLASREPCVILSIKGMSSGQTVSALAERGIRVHNRVSDAYSRHTLEALGIEECVRVSLAHYNSPGEVDALLRALHRI